ncbi:hypothetical protein [Neobacillus drentensis]
MMERMNVEDMSKITVELKELLSQLKGIDAKMDTVLYGGTANV